VLCHRRALFLIADDFHTLIGFKSATNLRALPAVVLLTPDDEGCVKGGTPVPRARQNVVLELGYFVGRLGRDRVCALKRGEVEIPSDFGGVVYEPFDDAGGWRQALGRELQDAGFAIDWNKFMR
jgi:predicted nucleotide-binding protein